ncbi:MAG: NADH-quinone oxidoreductase subunit L [Chloroflexi bacterium CFX6]|nr:NADH-quinone oxidoreductase subunit L [Chloroflexi bacterium CFX6]
MSAIDLLPLVPGLPLAGVIVLALLGGRLPARAAAWLATGLVGVAFALSAAIAWEFTGLDAGAHDRGWPGRTTPAAGATGATAGASDSADADHGDAGGPVVHYRLWQWMAAGSDSVAVTVAARDLEALAEVTAGDVGTVRIRPDALPSDEVRQSFAVLLGRMWDRDAVVGQRVMQPARAGTPLTLDNVPPSGDTALDTAVAAPAYEHRFAVDMALQLDGLSLLMLLVVTGVGFLIHVYSIGYMAHDAGIRRYFAYLNLFVFSMLTLVLGASFLVMFVGWELVGACSYLLIGFWYHDPANAAAGRKAFIVNRVGDFAFLIGLMLLWSTFGSLAYADVFPRAAELLPAGGTLAVAITALLLVGATGKSAQIPLYVWLPDAMAGPTPVSALIHAATMVTAGVYMIVRSHALFEQAPAVMAAVAVVGAATALVAAMIAVVQVDIKRVLAYSTISQLGYMFLAVGAGGYVAGMFHLMTHAFFKALLFLGAGSLMHAMEHGFHTSGTHLAARDGVPAHQDMRTMGGLVRKAPWTGATFVVGGLALAGLFPLAGFWSKDEILLDVWRHGGTLWTALYAVGLVTAFLTAFYTGRQLLLVLFGPARTPGAEHAHESPAVMTVPLIALAALTVLGGLPGIDGGGGSVLAGLLGPVVGAHTAAGDGAEKMVLAVVASSVALGGLTLAYLAYAPRLGEGRPIDPGRIAARLPRLYRAAWNKLYVDEIYGWLFVRPFRAAADFLWRVVDDDLVDGAVNGAGRLVAAAGQAARRAQTGLVRQYALSMLLGVVVIAVYLFMAR